MGKIGELAKIVGQKILDELPINRYWNTYAEFKDGRIIYDKDVHDFMMKHLRLRDRFDTRKLVEAAFQSFSILSGAAKVPDEYVQSKKNWKFKW